MNMQDSNSRGDFARRTQPTLQLGLFALLVGAVLSACGGEGNDLDQQQLQGPGQLTQALVGDGAAFVADVTVPDHMAIDSSASFMKTWRMRNVGTTPWSGFTACFTSGESFSAAPCVSVPYTASGATADVSVLMRTPASPTCAAKSHSAVWNIKNSAGTLVTGGKMTVVVTVNPTVGWPLPNLKSSAHSSPTNPFAAAGYGGQCTAYAWGRMMERTGKNLSPRGDAGSWYGDVPAASRSATPRADSVAVWTGGGHGHVAYVESVRMDGAGTTWITFTEANFSTCYEKGSWGGGYNGAPQTLSLASFKAHNAGYVGVIF